MNIEQRLNQVADRYRAQGYKVVIRPGPDDLPDFAKDFKIEIIAKRDDGCVLASAKKSQSDLESDREIPRYAEITEKEPGWRFDVIVLGSESQPMPEKRFLREISRSSLHEFVLSLCSGDNDKTLFASEWKLVVTGIPGRLPVRRVQELAEIVRESLALRSEIETDHRDRGERFGEAVEDRVDERFGE